LYLTSKELEQQVALFTPHLDTQGQLLSNMFMPFCKSLSEENLALRPSSFIHMDETGTYVGGKNAWAHITSND
jgi:hypothetical protein